MELKQTNTSITKSKQYTTPSALRCCKRQQVNEKYKHTPRTNKLTSTASVASTHTHKHSDSYLHYSLPIFPSSPVFSLRLPVITNVNVNSNLYACLSTPFTSSCTQTHTRLYYYRPASPFPSSHDVIFLLFLRLY